MPEQVVILSGVRTAIGGFGGALKDFAPAQLGGLVIREAIRRSGFQPHDVGHVVMGQVIPTKPQDAYMARIAALEAGIPVSTPALTVNRLCGSGLQAVVSAAQTLALQEAGFAIAGGAEIMSRAPHHVTAARFGQKMGSIEMLDALTLSLSDPREGYHMGITAENVAAQCGVTRSAQDSLALESQRRAARATAEGRFVEQILPVTLKTREGEISFQTDEHIRSDTNAEGLAALKPVFRKDGSVTAGNSSGINDGAAALGLATLKAAESKGLTPRARILGWGHAGVDPSLMGLGPVVAVPIALERAGLSVTDLDVIESNEAFAAQACAVADALGFDPMKTNINGSGIALGHPVGATGAMLVVKAIYELERQGRRYGLVTMCIGGGQGIALVVERWIG